MWASRYLLLLAWGASLCACVPMGEERMPLRRISRQQTFGITHLDIRDAILALDRNIRSVSNKLDRHEAREAQTAQTSLSTLRTITTTLTNTGGIVQGVAKQLVTMEERLLSLEALVQTTDERQRMLLGQLSQGLDRLLTKDADADNLPPVLEGAEQESAVLKVVKKIIRKLSGVEMQLETNLLAVTNEVKVVGETLGRNMSQLLGRQDQLDQHVLDSTGTTQSGLVTLSEAITSSTTELKNLTRGRGGGGGGASGCSGGGGVVDLVEVTSRLDDLTQYSRQHTQDLTAFTQATRTALEDHLTTLRALLTQSEADQALVSSKVANLTQTLGLVNSSSHESLANATISLLEAIKKGTSSVGETVAALGQELKNSNSVVMDVLDDRASQMENLQTTIMENYSEMSTEISSLKKVEQVMLHTADSVLDTKRSIEFGIQQIIFELGEIVESSGSTINNTLSDQIRNISFAILRNQSSALTNMTAKMEHEISQVWRQIGIMYEQMSQSVNLLDELQDTTKQHMNASLSRVGNMDGTVGKINTKVADVESNLNYLLGRLSLVVSEFNLMKSGVGEELMRLRDNLAKENNNPVHFAEGEPSSASRYDVNRKREVVQVSHEPAEAF